jgi:hypothetical protein
MWLWARRPLRRPQPHEVNQMQLFGPLFHQKVLHMARCAGNHFLPLDSHLGQWRSYSQCMWPKVHITNVSAPHMFHKLKEFIWTQLRLGYIVKQIYDKHKEIWWEWANACDLRWFPMIPRYYLLGPEAQEGHLALAQKPGTFHSVMGLCSS